WPVRIPLHQRHSDSEKPGLERGYGRADIENPHQYSPTVPVFLNIPPVNGRASADRNAPWSLPKVFVEVIRGAGESLWRCVAFLDDEGLIGSEDFLGVWPKDRSTTIEILAAILNGPVASGFVAAHAGSMRNPKAVLN